MATAILSNFGDLDTIVLHNIWNKIPKLNLLEMKMDGCVSTQDVEHSMKQEKELIIFAGHGMPGGLFTPSCSSTGVGYLLHAGNAHLIRAQKVIGIWCYASSFAERVGLKGFFSGMFISNPMEAYICGITSIPQDDITKYEIQFCQDLQDLILSDIPMKDWKEILRSKADLDHPVVKFNYDNLRYFE